MMEEQDVKDQVIRHVQFLMNERHWTVYRLAKPKKKGMVNYE